MHRLCSKNFRIQDEAVLEFCQRALNIDTFARVDYKNLCSLTVIFLGGSIPGFKFSRPGAMHNARFMAKGIYLGMLTLLQEKLEFLTDEDKVKINRVNQFIMTWYVPMFLQSSIACKAPSSDLAAMKAMQIYSRIDFEVGTEAYLSLNRHCWYLTEKMVV